MLCSLRSLVLHMRDLYYEIWHEASRQCLAYHAKMSGEQCALS